MWAQLCLQVFCKFQNLVICNLSHVLIFLIPKILISISKRAVKHLSFAFEPPLPAKTALTVQGKHLNHYQKLMLQLTHWKRLVYNTFWFPNLITETLKRNLNLYRKQQQIWENFPKYIDSYQFDFFEL